jgi:photosystem II stability/assembly factor-like uncharacterized protein
MRPHLCLAAALVTLLAGRAASANGRYPAASMVAFDPHDATHLVVSATFGLLESHDGGKTYAWRCESALEVGGQQDLMAAVTASGATVTAKFDGVATSADGCSFYFPPELMGRNIGDLSLSPSEPHALLAFYLDSRPDGGFDSQIVRSDDDGHTWAQWGSPLATDLLPLTIDIAPSDASRVYVSARLDGNGNYASALLRSTDGGRSFVRADIPETAQHHLAYIAAVHPTNPDRLYLRVFDAAGTRVWMSDDGGITFRKVFAGSDQLYGFAVSPDGQSVAFGGPGDGVWSGSSDGTSFTRRSDVLPTCLGWGTGGLFACADQNTEAFSIGLSRDLGATFETILRFETLCGQTGCGPSTDCGERCPKNWQIVGPAVGATCGLDAGVGDAAGTDDAADTTPDQDASSDVPPPADARSEGAPPRDVVTVEVSGGGCALRPLPQRGISISAELLALVSIARLCRRRRDQFLTIT